jgi:demethylmenaquinone methyltransferase/2-methoxy-6-polyprenyl-1,4-benzoquinol methylase
MFAGIAGRYDLANHLLSGGMDFLWRRRLVRLVRARQPRSVADLATGSGDVALAMRSALPATTRVRGLDFCEPMLVEARRKQNGRGIPPEKAVTFEQGDCLDLPLPDGSVDVLTIAFGLRNLENRQAGLREMKRVLTPGSGRLFVLEFSQPHRWFRPVYYAYLKGVLPLLAAIVTGRRDAYNYLAGSIESFPTRASLAAQIEAAGFSRVRSEALTFGVVAIHEAAAERDGA